MSSEWKKMKQRYWPTGSLSRFLKDDSSSSISEAFKKRISSDRPAAASLEKMNDLDLALALAGRLIKCMHVMGERRAERKADREFDSGIPCAQKHSRIQDQEPRDV